MNPVFQSILDKIQKTGHLSDEEKEAFIKMIKDSDKSQTMLQFKLERTEKDRHTLQIMLEESIEDLQKKSRAVEAQNRELEIESALEKVRTIAMGMRNRDDMLGICRTISQQLESLGIREIRNVQTAIFYQDKGTYVNYEYYRLHDKALVTEVDYTSDEISIEFATQMIKGSDEVFIRHLEGQQVKDWLNFQKTTNVFIDTHLEKAGSLTYQWFSLGPVAIGTSTYEPLNESEIELFKRFRNVFELAYRRYLDIEKAEAQAREAQIQLALERVRARTMAMQRSDELAEVAKLLFRQVKELGVKAWTTGFNIWQDDGTSYIDWLADSTGEFLEPYTVDTTSHPGFAAISAARQRGDDFFVSTLEGNEIKETYALLNKFGDKGQFQKMLDSGIQFPKYQINHVVFGSQVSLLFITYEPVPEAHDVFKRFGKVFEQTYTRFLDLQKAEAQAKESQIQLALERVRARTMAMQKSEELMEAANLLFQQVRSLGIPIWSCGYNIWEKGETVCTGWMSTQGAIQPSFRIPLTEHRTFIHMNESRVKAEPFYVEELRGEELADHYRYMFSLPDFKAIATKQLQNGFPLPQSQVNHVFNFKHGNLIFLSAEALPGAWDIFKRFTAVFEQTYTRFLDLQKAEAQAREAEIELALERVRARTMAMQRSEELRDAAALLFQQAQALGARSFACGFSIWGEEEKTATLWMAQESMIQPPFTANSTEDVFHNIYEAAQRGEALYVKVQEGKELEDHYRYMSTIPIFKGIMEKMEQAGLSVPTFQILHCAFFSQGFLLFITYEPVQQIWDVFKRFAKVFEQTYTRFLDLQKAEVQSRESQIQLALERVRARTMAMQRSNELSDVAALLFKQVSDLGVKAWTTGFNVWSDDNNFYTDYITNPQGGFMQPYTIDATKLPVSLELSNAKKRGEEYYVNYEEGESLAETYRQLSKFGEKQFTSILESGFEFPSHQYEHFVFGSKVSLMFITYESVPEEAHDVFKRFGKVFEQTYTRFLDLQKAEAQARESEIQLALERVRARSLAMHHTSELQEVVKVVADQLHHINIDINGGVFITINDEVDNDIPVWASAGATDYVQKVIVPFVDKPILSRLRNAIKQKDNFLVEEYSKEEKIGFFEHLFNHAPWSLAPQKRKQELLSKEGGYARSVAIARFTSIAIINHTGKNFSDQDNEILKRFGNVFEQSYVRFLDLQKAEAQAREAQVETALEKVRSRSLGMHRSDELQEVVHTVFEKLKELDVDFYTVIIVIFQENSKDIIWWMENKVNQQYPRILLKYADIPYLNDLFDAKGSGKELFSKCYVGEEKYKLYNFLFQNTDLKNVAENQKKFLLESEFAAISVAFAKNTGIHITNYSKKSFSEEENEILKRFAKVFDQAYTRFIDLQRSEAQAREAQIEAALERVRSRTLAMQRSDELAETASVLFQQLIHLGIEPNRLFINIIKDETEEGEFWITDEDGSKIVMAYSANMNTNPTFKKTYDGWKSQNKSLIIDMHGKELDEYFRFLSGLNVPFKEGLSQKRRLQYIAYFNKGFIGMASPDEQPVETMQLLERFAAVFNLTFTRFNDLKIAEAHALKAEQDLIEIKAARKHAEESLAELQATQKQLVQSEKMASLGELTAGIAHEIQNPLNFVNNFSEVSNELIEELKIKNEKLKIDDEEIKELLHDITQNLDKISHHGKRADAIVKGMLQHSRTSSSQKELTDINALADEYLRLAYHGLRAKDKSFNAKFITDFDNSVGKINIIPQDVGRVILNLINNAFYAVSEKQKRSNGQFEPTVSISTKKVDGKLLIAVADNGSGIPQHIVDKIFQPFFTTKPTGQGTGLGLSLAYDIIKVHGGDIKVETKEGEGSKFTVELPGVDTTSAAGRIT